MKSLLTYLDEKHIKKNIIDDFRVLLVTTRTDSAVGSSGSAEGDVVFRTIRRLRDECKERGLEYYIFYCEDGLIIKDDDGKWRAHNKGDDEGFEISSFDTVAIARGSVAMSVSRMDKLSQLEKIGIFCVNSRDTIQTCNDKYLTSLRLADAGILTPVTMLVINDEETDDAVDSILKKFDNKFPLIVKTLSGSKGVGVVFIESKRALSSTLQLIWKINSEEELLVQEYIETEYDVRCIVLGGKVQALMRRDVIKGDFRSNYSLGGKASKMKQSEKADLVCVEAAKAVDGVWVAVDYIPTEDDSPSILEVNSSPGTEGIETATGEDIVGELMDHISDKNNWRHKTLESGFLETIEIEGVGHIIGNFDTGNAAKAILHADKYKIKNNMVHWESDGNKFKHKLVKMSKFERGGLNAQKFERPIVNFNVIFNGTKYEDVLFILDDRTEKTTKALMDQEFIKRAHLAINPARKFVLSPPIGEDFDKYNKDRSHYNLVVKKKKAA